MLHKQTKMGLRASAALFLIVGLLSVNVDAQGSVNIIYPIIGESEYSNDFYNPRYNGQHNATDIFADKMQKVVSASDGFIQYVADWSGAGKSIRIRDSRGYTYNYYHLNNDRLGTDDGRAGGMLTYAPDVAPWNPVVRGQHIGYVGDSGNAESTPPHLHFEIIDPDGAIINPYSSLRHAQSDGRVLAVPAKYPQLPNEFLPYGNVAYVPLNLTAIDQVDRRWYVTSPGPGGGPDIRVFDYETGQRIAKFIAYDKNFRGGVDVASGDIDGDGVNEIITAMGNSGRPLIKIFSFRSAGYYVKTQEFFAYDNANRDGVYVTLADVNNDGRDEVVTSPGKGSGPHVKVFTFRQAGYFVKLKDFFVYDKSFRGGVDVAGGDLNGDQKDEIITGPISGMQPEIAVFDDSGRASNRFLAFEEENRTGVRLSLGDIRQSYGYDEIVVVPALNGGPHAKTFNGVGTAIETSTFAEPWWRDGYGITVLDGRILTSMGSDNRRASVR